MSDSLTTRPSLLVRLRDARDESAWAQFVEIYAPLVYGFARKHGLQDADAADLTQEVLRAVAGAAKDLDYDPKRGSFRGWLFTVVRNKLRNFLAAKKRHEQGSGHPNAQSLLNDLPAREEDQAALWDKEYQQQLFNWALVQVRDDFQDTTWQAFWLTAVEGKSGKETAKKLRMTVAAVYLAKGRVMARLKEQIRLVQDEERILP
jgi:RNA polymerase sigma-70 factor (ECF subfamily)